MPRNPRMLGAMVMSARRQSVTNIITMQPMNMETADAMLVKQSAPLLRMLSVSLAKRLIMSPDLMESRVPTDMREIFSERSFRSMSPLISSATQARRVPAASHRNAVAYKATRHRPSWVTRPRSIPEPSDIPSATTSVSSLRYEGPMTVRIEHTRVRSDPM